MHKSSPSNFEKNSWYDHSYALEAVRWLQKILPVSVLVASNGVFNIRQVTLFWFEVLHFIKKSSCKPVTHCLKYHISHLHLFLWKIHIYMYLLQIIVCTCTVQADGKWIVWRYDYRKFLLKSTMISSNVINQNLSWECNISSSVRAYCVTEFH